MGGQFDTSKVHDPESITQQVLDNDTSVCEKYDEPGLGMAKLSTISMNINPYKQNFDYLYNHEFEGTSERNTKRSLFKDKIDHIHN